MLHPARRRRIPYLRKIAAGAAALTLVMGMIIFAPTSAQATPSTDTGRSTSDKIQSALQETFESTGETAFWVRFAASADLTQARQIEDWVTRGESVAEALRDAARTSQASLRGALDSQGVDYQSFWATNALFVRGGTLATAQQIASRPEVEGLYAPVGYELIEPTPAEAEHQVNAVEWGIANINADDVWDQFDTRGQGITVASIDSGVQFDHPALVGTYRGNLGAGTFDHNYNWFDAASECSDAPCDFLGHGTHTMGTMVGDDGAGNQIGVAPETTWITTNGCCPSDSALIASGEWLLEPTDLAGQNPDASKRPHIINNSWGSLPPSTDPFMEDVLEAWDASGILGIWSNGNFGELGCESSGSPGSRTLTYSVGAHDISNTIADFSSRGPGQDGETKPNSSAPGVEVRSSFPDDSYGVLSGTSMAAPHVAGSVALLWSAAPALIGDTGATREFLDQSAIDTDDLQCGGTAAENNVYGEGRLDALALLQNAPIGETGTLAGTLTDAATGASIAGATVTITGEADRSLTTGPDGTYSAALSVGAYILTASAFGYDSQTADVTIALDETTRQDFALSALPTVTVSGVIRDGSGHGWPMYAKASVAGAPGASTYSNPFTGRYQLTLPADATYTLVVESQYPGYQMLTEPIEVGGGNLVRDLQMVIDGSCTAPGYGYGTNGVFETFDTGELPAGWEVTDNAVNGQVWRFDNRAERPNLTGGEGRFAMVDSADYGNGNQDTELISPARDMSDVDEPLIRFNQDFNWHEERLDEFANVDLSIDGGATWESVLHQSGQAARGPRDEAIEIPQAAGEPDVRVRFHYGNASFEGWWQIDNVRIGACLPVDGGLVAGHVLDLNTGNGLNGATVASVDRPDDRSRSFATAEDPQLADGFYWLFSSLAGDHAFTASAGRYVTQTEQVDVAADWTTRRDFDLAAGQLTVEPDAVEARVPLGGSRQRNLTITNTGTAPVEVELTERHGGFEILRADGDRVTGEEILASAGAQVVRRISLSPQATTAQLAGSTVPAALLSQTGSPAAIPAAEPWTDLPSMPRRLMDNNLATVDGLVYSFGGSTGEQPVADVYVFDPAAQSWTQLPDMPGGPRHQSAEGVIDGKVYLVSGWNNRDQATLIFDPTTGEWSTGADVPSGSAAAGSAVLDDQLYVVGGCAGDCAPHTDDVYRYDPVSDSWETLASYPIPISWQSCGAVGGQLYCAGGLSNGADVTATYAYDPATDSWTQRADMPANLWGAAYHGANDQLLISGGLTGESITNEGYAYNPVADSWETLPASNNLLFRPGSACGFYKAGGSAIADFQPTDQAEVLPGFGECGKPSDVPWLSVSPTTATLEAGGSLMVRLTLRADVAQPGTYTAAVRVGENTPYSLPLVEVTMTVTPPSTWGKITGTVAAIDCRGGQAPLAEATVHLSTWVMELTLYTDDEGSYAHWLDYRHSPLTMIVAKDGYQPQVRQSEVVAGEVTVEDWALKRVCAAASGGSSAHPI